MKEMVFRSSIVLFIVLCMCGIAYILYLRSRRQHHNKMLNAAALELEKKIMNYSSARVRILAFLNEDCRQCRTLQAPVLRRVREVYGDAIDIIEVDTYSSPHLAQRYHVLTVPTTILLDLQGRPHTINYGFTNAQSLLKQVEEILALDMLEEALP